MRFVAWSSPFGTPKTFWEFGIDPPTTETWWTGFAMLSKKSCSYHRPLMRAWNTSRTKTQSPIDHPFEIPATGRTADTAPKDHPTRASAVRGRGTIGKNPDPVVATVTVPGVRVHFYWNRSPWYYQTRLRL